MVKSTAATLVAAALLAHAAAQAGPAAGPGDAWPQLAHDAGRSGRSPDSPHPPFTIAWQHTITGERVDVWNQPVLANGRVFIGTIEGGMHCWPLEEQAYNAAGGMDIWAFKADGPIIGAAGYANGRLFFGAADGCCYALDASDGSLVWKTDVGRPGFSQAALIAGDRVFLGGRSGVFYAFDQSGGEILWRYDAGAPFLASAAYADGRVYCGAEDMRIRALDATTGALVWESDTLPGAGLLNHHVVADAGKAIVRTVPFTKFKTTNYSFSIFGREEGKPLTLIGWHTYPEAARAAGEAYWRNQDVPRRQRLTEFNLAMREAFFAEPETMTFHALDAATGKRAYIAPIVYNMSNASAPQPPVVGPDGFWYAGTTMSGKANECCMVKIDPATGDIVDTLQDYVGGNEDGWGGGYFTVMPDGSLSGDLFLSGGWTGDEDSMFSVGGKVLYGRHGHGGWDAIDLQSRIPFSHESHRIHYKTQNDLNRVMGFPGNAFTGFAIGGEYLVGTQVAGFGVLFCVRGVKGE